VEAAADTVDSADYADAMVPADQLVKAVYQHSFEELLPTEADERAFAAVVVGSLPGATSASVSSGSIVVAVAFENEVAAATATAAIENCEPATCIAFRGHILCPHVSGSTSCSDAAGADTLASNAGNNDSDAESATEGSSTVVGAVLGVVIVVLVAVIALLIRKQNRSDSKSLDAEAGEGVLAATLRREDKAVAKSGRYEYAIESSTPSNTQGLYAHDYAAAQRSSARFNNPVYHEATSADPQPLYAVADTQVSDVTLRRRDSIV